MNTSRETGISPEASHLFEGLRSFLQESADITAEQLFYLSALKIATFCNPDNLASLDAGITQEIEVNTNLASSSAAMLTRRHQVALTIDHNGRHDTISGLGYSTESVSYVALISGGDSESHGHIEHILNPDELSCNPIQNQDIS